MGQYFCCFLGQMCVIKILHIGTSTVFTTAAINRWWPRCQSISVALDEIFSCASSFHQVYIFSVLLSAVRFLFLLIIFCSGCCCYIFIVLTISKEQFPTPSSMSSKKPQMACDWESVLFIDCVNYLNCCMELLF